MAGAAKKRTKIGNEGYAVLMMPYATHMQCDMSQAPTYFWSFFYPNHSPPLFRRASSSCIPLYQNLTRAVIFLDVC